MRVFNGLEAHESPQRGFLGALTPSSVGRVGVRARRREAETLSENRVLARAREVREQMARCISENTVHECPERLGNDGRDAVGKLRSIAERCAARKEILEQRYLLARGEDTEELISELSSVEAQIEAVTEELGLWEAPVPMPGLHGSATFQRHPMV